ncbi:DUF6299 family protein [Streptomyces sp. NPDC051211]|uniref:DUF6299 family protein n=1 Tax=Streptomyces sp. NPDC051211 TaxID=3154643 RepID=UPI00344FD6C8
MRITTPRLALAAVSAVAAAAAFTAPASAGAFGNEISVQPYGHISENGTVTLSGTYRCTTPSPSGAVQISATIVQDGTRLGFGGEEAVCDGEQRKWSATGSLRMTPNIHPGGAGAEVRLQSVRPSGGLIPHVSYVAEEHRDVELVERKG